MFPKKKAASAAPLTPCASTTVKNRSFSSNRVVSRHAHLHFKYDHSQMDLQPCAEPTGGKTGQVCVERLPKSTSLGLVAAHLCQHKGREEKKKKKPTGMELNAGVETARCKQRTRAHTHTSHPLLSLKSMARTCVFVFSWRRMSFCAWSVTAACLDDLCSLARVNRSPG